MINYLIEIRNRIFLVFICLFFTFVVSYFYKELIFLDISKIGSFTVEFSPKYFIFTDVTELFSIYIRLVKFITFITFFIYGLYHFFVFISPALYKNEYLNLKSYLRLVFVFWLFSLCLSYFVFVPALWVFFTSFNSSFVNGSVDLYFELTISEYISFLILIFYQSNLQFQFFVVLVLFLKYYHIDKKFIKNFRNVFYFSFLSLATIITPPDITSQLFCFSILICFFEMSVYYYFMISKLIR